MIILHSHTAQKITAAIFDFDGTLSTLRSGWEQVMAPLMAEVISGGADPCPKEVYDIVDKYIDKSTGIQTIQQMKWLVKTASEYGLNANVNPDPWFYKSEYNERLMRTVAVRRDEVLSGKIPRERYIIAGAESFLRGLKDNGIRLFAASGTDDADVKQECAALGLDGYFEQIAGSMPHSEDCSKQAVIERLMRDCGNLIVVGDGRVEIELGRRNNALTLGVASDEVRMSGINSVKQVRLTDAGAHAIVPDFSEYEKILVWMGCGR